MSIFSRILVGTDGSEAADEAVDLAVRLAHEHDGELVIAHAVNWVPPIADMAGTGAIIDPIPVIAELQAAGAGYVDRAILRARAAGVLPERRIVDGEPALSLLRLAQAEDCTLIVVATHGRAGLDHLFVGSTTEAVLRGSTLPVLTVCAGKRTLSPGRCIERIVVGIDDSEPSDAALGAVIELPAEDRRHVLLCSVAGSAFVVGGPEYHQAAIEELHEDAERVVETALAAAAKYGLKFEGSVVDGKTAPALIRAAEQEQADLIVLGSHGRRGLRRLFLGSVAENVVQTAPVPVLVVRVAQNAKVPFAEPSRRLATVSA